MIGRLHPTTCHATAQRTELVLPVQHDAEWAALGERMEAALKAQGDPRMFGNGNIFDEYKPTAGQGFYEKFMRGERVNAGWVNPTDFEPGPLLQNGNAPDSP